MSGTSAANFLALAATGLTVATVLGNVLISVRARGPRLVAIGGIAPLAIWLGIIGALCAGATGLWPLGALPLVAGLLWRQRSVHGWADPVGSPAPRPETRSSEAHTGVRYPANSLTITSANLLVSNSRADAVAAHLASWDADLVVTIETTGNMRQVLIERSGWEELSAGSGDRGSMVRIWRRPGTDAVAGHGLELHSGVFPEAVVTVAGEPVHVVGIHLAAPVTPSAVLRWERECRELVDRVREHPGRLILAGDFNASLAHPALRVLRGHLTDAAASDGRPLLRTWPARGIGHGRGALVPIMNLDHVLFSAGLAVTSLRARRWPGTDHLALTAAVGVTR